MDCQKQQNSRVKIIAVVAIVGLLSAVFGFAAEATKLQLDDISDMYVSGIGCSNPSPSGHTTFAILALIALVCFRVYCPGIRSPSSVVQLSRYLSWMAWFVAMIFYVVGLLMTKNQGDTLEYEDRNKSYYKCNVVKPGIFGAGASFALTSVVLEIVYLVVVEHQIDKTATDPSTDQPSTVAMC